MNASDQKVLNVESWWCFWKNPLIVRFIRSRLRLGKSLGWVLAVAVLTSFIFFTTYLTSTNRELLSAQDACRGLLVPLFVIQSIILMFLGTGTVASGLVQDRIAGTMDYQRLTPMSPLAKIIGYLFGLPIREYLLFSITIPFTVYALWVGKIPFGVFVPVYIAFFTSVILYHLTGMAAGMIARKWKFAARLTQGTVILLYVVLPLFSNLGLFAFQFLTFRPVLEAKLVPLLPEAFQQNDNPFALGMESVPFFNFEFSVFAFTVVLHGLLIWTIGLMVYRKWRDQNQHSLSKQHGLILFAAIAVMILGNLWPLLTRNTQIQLPVMWATSIENLDQGVAIALPFILGFFLLFIGMWILSLTTPTHHEVLRGWRRATKFNQPTIGAWRDEAPSTWVVTGICLVTLGAMFSEIFLLHQNQFWDVNDFSFSAMLRLPLAFVIAILSYYASLISLENRRIFLVLLMGWGLPIMLGIFLGAALGLYKIAIYVAALSPVVLILLGAGQLTPIEAQNEMGEYYGTAISGYWLGLTLQTILIVWLIIRWTKIHKQLAKVARSGSPQDLPASVLYQED